MEETLKVKLRLIRLKYIQLMAKYGRGKGQFGIYNDLLQMTIMAGLGITLWNTNRVIDWWIIHIVLPEIPIVIVYPLMVFLVIFFIIWGFIDQKIIKLTQSENAYNHEVLDTWLVKQFDDIKKQLKILEEQLKNNV